ncbi:sucrase ferredoxin [Pseudotabrizicola sp. 4114]|uniref:sucrase ferredoxin n=1 Tax=Pseudotabrizicola sp. 4114 TaxID=2817731 RepID=UPI00285540E1|nr:hypothetical protein [Pseudorhodobacter sp. 4114]
MAAYTFCRDLCIARGEPLVGTGAVMARYALLHWPRADWRVPRINARHMPPDLSSAIIAAGEAGIHVALVDGDNIALSCGTETLPEATPEAAATALLRLSRGEPLADPGLTAIDDRLTIMCCTDGKMDPCCALYGFATWKALRAVADPQVFRVLQSTHIGGCRFAASLLVLPDRARYGRLTPDQVPDFLTALQSHQPYLPAWRGDPLLDSAAQVADHAARSYAGKSASVTLEQVSPDMADSVEFIATIAALRLHIRLQLESFAVNTRCRTISADVAAEQTPRWCLASIKPLASQSA